MMSEFHLRREVVAVGRRLAAARLVAATDGNISARLPGRRVLVTPAGSSLGELREDELIVVPAEEAWLPSRAEIGRLPARRRPTSELPMHLCAYAERPDIGAIVHAHPPTVTAFTIAGFPLDRPVLPEVLLSIGPVPVAPYATPATEEGAICIRELIRAHDVIALDRHGAIAVGRDPLDGFRKLEKLEQAAEILWKAHLMGSVRTLPPEEVARLEGIRERASPQNARL